MHNGTRFPGCLLMLAVAAIFSACTTSLEESYQARIRWTSDGIPHIEAQDLGSLGFGDGYAQAREEELIVRGEKSQ